MAVATISSWESLKDPKLPPPERLSSYALFFAQSNPGKSTRSLPDESDLTAAERKAFEALYQELVDLRDAVKGVGPSAGGSIWTFENGPITIICPEIPTANRSPLAEEGNPNYTRTYRFADLDALIELWGQIRASNPTLRVERWLPHEVEPAQLAGHLVVLGGIGWNRTASRVQERLKNLPVQQVEVPELKNGEIFRLSGADKEEFWPQWTEYEAGYRPTVEAAQLVQEQTEDAWIDGKYRELSEDVAFLARLGNPYSENGTLTICSGIYSRGVLGAVMTLTDPALAEANAAYIAERFPSRRFAMLLRVPVVNGKAGTPNLASPESRLYEWSPDDKEGRGSGSAA
ncbi:hypothetical protein [Kribbella sp. NPDC051770]|uniref:hypothetical protein n=1 Tax=Kribbella sp. NPDC051770 TaxID=3155413 RepID=UPI00341D9E0C